MKAKYMLYVAGVVVSLGAAAIQADAADRARAATRPTQSTPTVTLPRTAAPIVRKPVDVKVPVKAAESALTSKQPTAGAGVSLDRPIDGIPARVAPGAPPASGNSTLVGAVEVPLDPSVRPDLANLSGSRLDGFSKGVTGSDLSNAADVTNLRPQTGSRLDGFSKGVIGSAEGVGVQATPGRNAESMFGTSPFDGSTTKEKSAAGTAMAPVGYDDEGVHAGGKGAVKEAYGDTTIGKAGEAIGNGLGGPTGQALKQAVDEIDGKSSSSGSTGNSSASSSSGTTATKGYKKETSSDGNVTSHTFSDGTVEIENKTNGTTTTLRPDGSTKTVTTATGKEIEDQATKPSTKMPDPDHQGVALPAAIQKQIDADKARLRAIGPKRGNGAVDFGEGDTTAKDGAVRIGAVPDKQKGLVNPGSAGTTTAPRPSVDQSAPPRGADPNNTDPTED